MYQKFTYLYCCHIAIVFLPDSTTNEKWLEMHKLPKDHLLKELEAAGPKDVDARKGTSSPVMVRQ
jgi:hypothetical protein